MNKQQLVDAVGERLGDRRTAAVAVVVREEGRRRGRERAQAELDTEPVPR